MDRKQTFFFYLHKKMHLYNCVHLQACFFQIIKILDKWEIICTCAHKCISKYCIIKLSKDISIIINVSYRISKIKQISMWNVTFLFFEYNSTDIFLLSTCMYAYTRCIFIKHIVFLYPLDSFTSLKALSNWSTSLLTPTLTQGNFFSSRNAYCKKYMKDSCSGE